MRKMGGALEAVQRLEGMAEIKPTKVFILFFFLFPFW
jgi:hypothetical protein